MQYLKNARAPHKGTSASLAEKDVTGTDQRECVWGLVPSQLEEHPESTSPVVYSGLH